MELSHRSFLCLFVLSIFSHFSHAGNTSSIDAYMMLSSEPEVFKSFSWDGSNIGVVSASTQNWNQPSAERWGVANTSKSDRYPVQPYSFTDPGFSGPNGESYGIEIEFGDTTFAPRSTGTKNVRFYTDFGQTGIVNSGIDRAEVHIRSTLQQMHVSEGDTIWIGWSEYYTHLDTARSATVFQFRNQPSESSLAYNGFGDQEIAELVALGVTESGPACAVEVKAENGQLHYQFAAREGAPTQWSIPNQHVVNNPIQTDRWYDFIVKMKYSQGSDGIYEVWLYDPSVNSTYAVTDMPEWLHQGATMYTYPTGYAHEIPSPEFRIGIYRWAAKKANDITQSDRYMTKYLGPLRIWKGDGDEGFEKVKPR